MELIRPERDEDAAAVRRVVADVLAQAA